MITEKQWKKIKELQRLGYRQKEISSQLGISKNSVYKYLKIKEYEGYNLVKRKPSKLDAYRKYIKNRIERDQAKIVEIFREIRALGYSGGKGILWDYVTELRRGIKAAAIVRTSETLPGRNMLRHKKSYRKVLKDGNTGGSEMAGKRVDFALSEYRKMYRNSSKLERGRILDDFCKLTKYHRKYAITLLNKDDVVLKVMKNRVPFYSEESLQVIERIWEVSDYPCSERLVAVLPLWLPWAKKHMKWITPEMEKEVLSISARQIDRRLQGKKKSLKRKMYGRTKPGSLLKHHIPVKTDNWDVEEPGFTEIDLVSHSGSNASGTFIYSLNLTDIHTGWVETIPIMGKTEIATTDGLKEIRKALPFPLKGIDSDNGSEFINEHLFDYCNDHDIQFTRGRAYKKNDNAHIEQKNWTHVRKIIGYERYDTEEHLAAMYKLYRKKLRLMMNLFQPCVKLKKKERVGSKIKRSYEPATTPLNRLISYYEKKNLHLPFSVTQLIAIREKTDPFKLSSDILKMIKMIQSIKNKLQKKVI